MEEQFSRSALVLGDNAIEKLKKAHVAVFGIGGVGGFTVEALARCGVGALDLIDPDKVCLSNINRQILALHSTLDEYKVDVAQKRIIDINPNCCVTTYKTFFLPENAADFDFTKYDYIVDAVDTVKAKIELAVIAEKFNVPIISSMGAGNKLDPTAFKVADIYKTSVCPLAKVMRSELKKRNIKRLKTVFSEEIPQKTDCRAPGSLSFVPSVVGLIIAGEVIKDLIKTKD
jgi:tRNA A37 threonylcarbamoyladenosine dehydratase